jgi:hypothetical protein
MTLDDTLGQSPDSVINWMTVADNAQAPRNFIASTSRSDIGLRCDMRDKNGRYYAMPRASVLVGCGSTPAKL